MQTDRNRLIFSEPLELLLGYSYNLNSIIKVDVTEEFLSLDEVTRNCQEKKTFGDCLTDKYLSKMKDNCKCLPFKMGLSERVKDKLFILIRN